MLERWKIEGGIYTLFNAAYFYFQILCSLYSKTLSVLQGFPKDAAYRNQTEQVIQQRLQIVQAEDDIQVIEKKIGCGQVEELIDQVYLSHSILALT